MKAKIAGKIIKYFTMILLACIFLYPLGLVILTSFKEMGEIYTNTFGLPEKISFVNFEKAWIVGKFSTYYKNSLFVTVLSVLFTTLLATLASFAFTRKDMVLKRCIYIFFIAGLAFSPQIGIIPLYKQMVGMGLNNSLLGLALVRTAYGLPFSIFVIYGFFKQIPVEIEEAAVIEGCSNFTLYKDIIVRLSFPAIATTVIFNTVGAWNDMFFPLVLLSDSSVKTLPIGLLAFKGEFECAYNTMFAGVIIVSLPVIAAFLGLQKFFVQGITAGAVKG